MGVALAVDQSKGAYKSAHTGRPPPLQPITLGEQIGDCRLTPDEHRALSQQMGFDNIAVLVEALLQKTRVS